MLISVASFTDAWIETPLEAQSGTLNVVASFTDAWIETLVKIGKFSQTPSHLLQMRGLKHFSLNRELHWHGRIFYRCVD